MCDGAASPGTVTQTPLWELERKKINEIIRMILSEKSRIKKNMSAQNDVYSKHKDPKGDF